MRGSFTIRHLSPPLSPVTPEEVAPWARGELAKRRREAEPTPGGRQAVARSAGTVWGRVMSLPVILRPAADSDIQVTHDELEQVQAGLGDRFVVRVREVLERIEAMPEMYGLVWRDGRAARLRKFRHVVCYVAFAARVAMLAVVYGPRHPPARR